MMGRKLRFCVAVVTLLMLLVAAPTEAAKKKKKKAAKPAQQTSQSANPTGYYVRPGQGYVRGAQGRDAGSIRIKWADKQKTSIKVEIEVEAPGLTMPYFGEYTGTARLNGNQAVFRGEEGGRMTLKFNGNTVSVDADETFRSYYCGVAVSFNGTYSRQKQKQK